VAISREEKGLKTPKTREKTTTLEEEEMKEAGEFRKRKKEGVQSKTL